MRRSIHAGRGASLALFLLIGSALGADGGFDLDAIGRQAARWSREALTRYEQTPPADRVAWGGLIAAAGLGLGVVLERSVRLKRKKVVPDDFSTRFLERLQDGRLDRGKALDFCELNASPASRIAFAAVKRWGRSTGDLDRAVGLAHRVEAERLRRHVGTLRRIAALAPLIGLLGTLTAVGRVLAAQGASATAAVWGPALASALWPLTAGVALATLALVAYDGLAGRVEQLSDALDRVGAETVDAIALSLPTPSESRINAVTKPEPQRTTPSPGSARTPHQVRLEVPRPQPRVPTELEDAYD